MDHVHEHFVAPVRVVNGRYMAPTGPGAGTELFSQSVTDFSFYRSRLAGPITNHLRRSRETNGRF